MISGPKGQDSSGFCFLGNDRLLTVSKDLRLYSIENLSQAPQLLACFLMPVSVTSIDSPTTMNDDIARNGGLQLHAQRTMWTSDPKNRLLGFTAQIQNDASNSFTFVISTRIFFDLQVGRMATIPWECWGPLNSRIFPHDPQCDFDVCGNRVLHTFPATSGKDSSQDMGYKLHLMDFSPLAVERRQGLGKVVSEPSTIDITESAEKLTTFLPYVVVEFDRTFDADQLIDIWFEGDRIYLPKPNTEDPDSVGSLLFNASRHTDFVQDTAGELEVIDMEWGSYILQS